MYEPSLLDPVSIRGRMAFGVVCLERVCRAWGIDDPKMHQLIDVFWQFVEVEGLGSWEDAVDAALPRSAEASVAFGFDRLDAARRDSLYRLVYLVARIGKANLFGGYVNEVSRTPTLDVAMFLHSYRIPVPDIGRFRQPLASGGVGWGYPCPRSVFGKVQ